MNGIRIEVSRNGGLTRFVCHGRADLDQFMQVADRIRAEMDGSPRGARVFVDLVGIDGDIEDIDRFRLGEYVAETLPGLRIAVCVREGAISKFGEDTAVNRGADVRVSHDPAELMAWLQK